MVLGQDNNVSVLENDHSDPAQSLPQLCSSSSALVAPCPDGHWRCASVLPVLGRQEQDIGVHMQPQNCQMTDESTFKTYNLVFIGFYFLKNWALLGFYGLFDCLLANLAKIFSRQN